MDSDWHNLTADTPLPFPEAALVGITKVQGKTVKVIDWGLIRTYFDNRGKYQWGGFALVKLICEGHTLKIKATNPGMISVLKNATGPFTTLIDRGGGGDFIFASDQKDLSKAARRRLR